MSTIAKRPHREFNVWPGYVDALSALLMVVIFLVLIFSVVQFLLSQVLSGQESELAILQGKINELTTQLGLEEQRNREMAANISDLSLSINALTDTKTMLSGDVENKENRIQELTARIEDQKQALEEERQLSAGTRAQIAQLNRSIAALLSRLETVSSALDLANNDNENKDAQIKDLGKRLNLALARRVNDLEFYRSDFFGRLRTVLGENPLIRIEGDRFVFQAELLFASGAATLEDEGRRHLSQLAVSLKELAGQIPKEIDWILRIDGHTDRVPVTSGRFSSNWELSTARALSVVQFLASQGIPEAHMAAAGFSKFHPLDSGDSTEAYRKNRRIEIKLTSR